MNLAPDTCPNCGFRKPWLVYLDDPIEELVGLLPEGPVDIGEKVSPSLVGLFGAVLSNPDLELIEASEGTHWIEHHGGGLRGVALNRATDQVVGSIYAGEEGALVMGELPVASPRERQLVFPMSCWDGSAVLVVALLTVGQLACSGCSESSGGLPAQGGSGGFAQDAATDTVLDAPKDRGDGDAPGDSPKDQASQDVEASADGGLWEPSPYAAFLQCPIEQLVAPALVPPYPWLDCEGMPTGCKMLDTSSLVGTSGYTLTFVGRVGGSANPRFSVIRGIGGDRFSPTLFRYDGSIAAAWMYNLSADCVTRIAWIGDEEIALYISAADSAMESLNLTWRVLVGSPTAILAGTAEQYDLKFDEFNLNAIEQLSVSETLVVADGQPGGRMFVAQRPSGSFEEVPQPGALWSKHLLVGSEVIAAGFEGKGNLYVRHADGGVEPFRAAPERAEAYPGGTGQTLAWQEGVNGSLTGGYETMEVWSAPFTTKPAELTPKKLMDLPNSTHIPPANGEGWYVVPIEPIHAASNSPVRLIQLSTGKYIDLPPPTGHAYTEMVGVAGGEAWFLLRQFPGSKDPVTIARVDLSGLDSLLQ